MSAKHTLHRPVQICENCHLLLGAVGGDQLAVQNEMAQLLNFKHFHGELLFTMTSVKVGAHSGGV